MPYVIAFIIMIVAAGALLLFRQPAEAPALTNQDESPARLETEAAMEGVPEGFTPPTTPPPSMSPGDEDSMVETDGTTSDDAALRTAPEAVAAPSTTYVAEASYFTPRRTEHDMTITLELEGTTVVDANVTYDGGAPTTPQHSSFDAAYATEVIGVDINELELSRTGGASLTSNAFNEAVAAIRAQI